MTLCIGLLLPFSGDGGLAAWLGGLREIFSGFFCLEKKSHEMMMEVNCAGFIEQLDLARLYWDKCR